MLLQAAAPHPIFCAHRLFLNLDGNPQSLFKRRPTTIVVPIFLIIESADIGDEIMDEAEGDGSRNIHLEDLVATQVSGQSNIELSRSTSTQPSRRGNPRVRPLGYFGKKSKIGAERDKSDKDSSRAN